jgi:hypothetical protein
VAATRYRDGLFLFTRFKTGAFICASRKASRTKSICIVSLLIFENCSAELSISFILALTKNKTDRFRNRTVSQETQEIRTMASAFLLTFTRSGEVQCLLDDDRRSPQKDLVLDWTHVIFPPGHRQTLSWQHTFIATHSQSATKIMKIHKQGDVCETFVRLTFSF